MTNNESAFLKFMKSNGPNSDDAKKNYISWMRFVSDNFSNINETISKDRIEEICLELTKTKNERKIYKNNTDISNIRAALNKYLLFMSPCSEFSEEAYDLESIIGHKISRIKKYEIDARIGQGKYRNEVIEIWGMCSLTKYYKVDLLVASHIKPWKVSSDAEKVDPYNGLLLQPNIDKLFDSGYITFSDEGELIVSSLLTEIDKSCMGISSKMKLLMVDCKHKPYLYYHRNNVFME